MTRRIRKVLNPRFSRRTLLAGLGASAALTPFLPVFETRAGDEIPKRLLLVFSPNGTLHDLWKPSGSETSFTLGELLAPLTPFQDRLIVLDGLEAVREGPGDGHQKGMALLWSASKILPGTLFEEGGDSGNFVGWGGGITVDQHVANEIGDQTPFSSLEFGVQARDATVWSRMSYAGPDQPIPPEDDPKAVFERLFSEFGQSAEQLDKIRAEKQSVIDVVKSDLDGLSTKVASEDQLKIDAHLQAIREVEKRLTLPYGEACELPDGNDGLGDVNANDNFPAVSRAQIDQLVMSLACDLTRVASLQWSRAVSGTRFTWLDDADSDGHHGLSHEGDENSAAQEALRKINIWYAEEFAYLLSRLDSIPEGDGTMLDNTLVVWGNELAKGNSHSNHPVPFVLAGSAGGFLQTGRYLEFDRTSHARLLVSICHAMGLDGVHSFGDIDDGSGGLQGLS